jgi:hypothetical protein
VEVRGPLIRHGITRVIDNIRPKLLEFPWVLSAFRTQAPLHRVSTPVPREQEAACPVGVDQGTVAKWEQGKREPQCAFLGRVRRFLQDWKASRARRAG